MPFIVVSLAAAHTRVWLAEICRAVREMHEAAMVARECERILVPDDRFSVFARISARYNCDNNSLTTWRIVRRTPHDEVW